MILAAPEVHKLISETKWEKPQSAEDKKNVAYLIVAANNLCYTLFFDSFKSGGFYIHGPYDVSKKFGDGATLIVREYHDINPKELWPDLEMPCKSMRICGIYKNLDLKLDFLNHPISTVHVVDKLIAYRVYVDDIEIEIGKINKLAEFLSKVSSEQTKKIRSMADLEKVKKGAEIEFYLFKRLRDYMGDDSKPKYVEEVIKKFGDKFLKQFNYAEQPLPSPAQWKRMFDPRDDYY